MRRRCRNSGRAGTRSLSASAFAVSSRAASSDANVRPGCTGGSVMRVLPAANRPRSRRAHLQAFATSRRWGLSSCARSPTGERRNARLPGELSLSEPALVAPDDDRMPAVEQTARLPGREVIPFGVDLTARLTLAFARSFCDGDAIGEVFKLVEQCFPIGPAE